MQSSRAWTPLLLGAVDATVGREISHHVSVRLSQLLVALVLAFAAVALFRTASAYEQTAAASDVRMKGSALAERETRRLGRRVATIEELAARTAVEGNGFTAKDFERAARALMRGDLAIKAIDYFDAADVHVAHIAAQGPDRLGAPLKRSVHVSRAEIEAVELVLFDADLSRATSVSDVPASPSKASAGPDTPRAHFYLATRVEEHGEVGTIVEYLDAQQLLLNDLSAQAPGAFTLDDGHGKVLQTASFASKSAPDRLTFPIPFADRVLELTLTVQPSPAANPWWFAFGWLALVFAIVLPMEVVGSINRRVQALNEELETRVAARTKELEESLRESRRLSVVVESVHEGVMTIGFSGIIRYVNDALCSELHCKPGDMIDKNIADVPPVGLSEQQLADIRAAVSEMGFVYREMERTRGDGTTYVAGITFTRHETADTNALIAVSRDVTARRRLVDELLEAKGNLERETRARADFIATASHELRTPATTLRTLAALLLEKLGPREALPPDDAKLLAILDHESRRLAHLVDDLLKIAKIDALEAGLSDAPIDLGSVVTTELEEVRRFGEPGPSTELHLPASPVTLRGDEDALRSVIHNLVDNARKFTSPDGRVDVTVEQDASHARLIVSDSGVGITASDLPHIFERFYRAPLTASKAPGAGLGLAIVARLVELMHGTISVASEVGRGTTITVEYPLKRAVLGETAEGTSHA